MRRVLPYRLAIASIVLLGFALRFCLQTHLAQRMGFDDGYYALNAASLIDVPRLTPFFADNFGRESGWIYFLALFFATIGKTPFAAHVASSWIGVLTIACVYRLSRDLLGKSGAFWAALAFAIAFGHVVLSYIGYRAITYPLMITLALCALVRAARARRTRLWMAFGSITGAAIYTYFAALVLIPFVVFVSLLVGVRTRQRVNTGIAAAVTLLIITPMLLFGASNTNASTNRIRDSARLSAESLQASALAWAAAPFIRGDLNIERNAPGRPLFDAAIGALWLVGIAGSALSPGQFYRNRWFGPLVLAGLALTILPSLVSYDPPHFLRAIGLFVPSAMLIGAAAARLSAGRSARAFRIAAVTALFAASFVASLFDLPRWFNDPAQYYDRHTFTHIAADYFLKHTDPSRSVAFSPEEIYHDGLPDSALRFRAIGLRPRHVSAANPDTCMAIADASSTYAHLSVSTRQTSGDFAQHIAPFARATPITAFTHVADAVTTYTQTIYAVTPTLGVLNTADAVVIGKQGEATFRLWTINAPATVRAGEALSMVVAMRAATAPAYNYRMAVSVIDQPEGYESRNRWSLQDDFICALYPTNQWAQDQIVFRRVSARVPEDIPAGRYALILRIYGGIPFQSVEDLAVLSGQPQQSGHLRLPLTIDADPARDATADAPSAGAIKALSRDDGYIREWGLIGGFPGAGLQDDVMPGGEAAFDGAIGARRIVSRAPKIDIARWVSPRDNSVAYAYVWIKSDAAREVQLGLNSDDGIAVWLNGAEVWRNAVSRYVADPPNDVDIPFVTLKPGWNLLLIKVNQVDGDWSLQCRLRDTQGVPIRDLITSLTRE